MNKKNPSTIVLLVLLALRAIMQVVAPLSQGGADIVSFIAAVIFMGLYIAAFVGVMQGKRYGYIVTIVVAAVDLLAAISISAQQGSFAAGAIIVDVVFIALALQGMKQVKTAAGISAPVPAKTEPGPSDKTLS